MPPKQNQKGGINDGDKSKGKGKKGDVVGNEADDDFDNMVADLRASDLPIVTTNSTTATTGSSSANSSSSSSSSESSRTAHGTPVTEAMIIQASAKDDVAQLRRWAKRGVRVISGEPLSHAVLKNKIGAVRILVTELGADDNRTGEDGCTPLYIAAYGGNQEMVQCLAKELGADVNLGDEQGFTPLHVAVAKGHLAVVRCMVKDLSADVNRRTKDGDTSLRIAAQEEHLNVVRLLVGELGADVNEAAEDGITPLHAAARAGHLEIVRCLVELDADVNQITKDGSTSLMVAAEQLHHKIVRYLLKNGADAQATHRVLGTHCANPSCTNAGRKKCERCLRVYFCGSACIRAHWPAHKAECKVAAANLKAIGNASSTSSSSSS
jgi:ankyrin repeat protein